MDFSTFILFMALIYGLALITSRVNWSRETADLRELVSSRSKKTREPEVKPEPETEVEPLSGIAEA